MSRRRGGVLAPTVPGAARPHPGRTAARILKQALAGWIEHNAPRLGAALAYYTAFSLGPLLVIAIAVAGFAFGEDAARRQIVGQVADLIGHEGASALERMVESAGEQKRGGIVATLLGAVVLLFGASGVFAELQDSLNTVWGVKPRPGRGLLGMIADRFLSFVMVLGVAFLLLVSLLVSAALAALGTLGASLLSESVLQAVSTALSFAVITALFAAIFKVVPDVEVRWRDVWLGAAVTSLLFSLGKLAIGLYLGKAAVASAFGAAGSLVVILVWVYYSAQIVFFGAELTKAYAE
ncbi:MAG TPA: YihY/virulence factor BrkB family protein, partial [Vicinamibacteria bacterium]|nr:YihY/virulence factor BrkB family protein [Vicinamibacteria bacterium]